MTGKTHFIGGVTVAAACLSVRQPFPEVGDAAVLNAVYQGVWIASCVFGSLLPDIDYPHTTLGHKLGPISVLINKCCGHRGFFHSLLFLALVYLPFHFFLPTYSWIGLGILLGGISHILLDMLNHTGVALFWPYKKKFSVASIELNSMEEIVVDIILGIGLVYSLYLLYKSMAIPV